VAVEAGLGQVGKCRRDLLRRQPARPGVVGEGEDDPQPDRVQDEVGAAHSGLRYDPGASFSMLRADAAEAPAVIALGSGSLPLGGHRPVARRRVNCYRALPSACGGN
jgi:hypothetical protein